MIRAKAAEGSMPLDLEICAVEQRLLERRGQIGRVARRIGQDFRARLSTPTALTVAVGFGIYLEQRGPRPSGSLAKLISSAVASRSLVLTLLSWIRPAPPAVAGDDTPLS